jgi:hypothetical protein
MTTNPGKTSVDWKTWLTIISLLFGSGILITAYQSYKSVQAPKFSVSAINTLESSKVYEITNHFIGVDPAKGKEGIIINWGLEVIPSYSGDTQYGEVRVIVVDPNGNKISENKWDNFTKSSQTLKVDINPYVLSQKVGWVDYMSPFQNNIFETGVYNPPETNFEIKIIQSRDPSHPLYTDTLKVINAPWYQYSTLSSWKPDGSIDIYVHGKNLGGASEFAVVCDIFEISQIPGWAWNPWSSLDYQIKHVTVGSGQDFSTTLHFPQNTGFTFEKGKVYFANIYLSKKQNYAEFPQGSWETFVSDFGSYSERLLFNPR